MQIRPHRDVTGWRLLGDYDESGQWLGDAITSTLATFSRTSSDGTVEAAFESKLPSLKPDQVGFSFLSGRKGITSSMRLSGARHPRRPDDSEDMRSAALFTLPRKKKAGWMAIHVPEGRSIKSLIDRSLRERFSADNFALELNPLVPENALREAVERDAIESVSLIKHLPTKSDAFEEAAQWGGDEEVGRLVVFMGSRRNRKLRRDPVKKFLEKPTPANRKALYEFHGLPFDEVGIEVDLPDGSRRTFFVESRPGGHPMTVAIKVDATDDFGATPDVLSRELRKSLISVVGS